MKSIRLEPRNWPGMIKNRKLVACTERAVCMIGMQRGEVFSFFFLICSGMRMQCGGFVAP